MRDFSQTFCFGPNVPASASRVPIKTMPMVSDQGQGQLAGHAAGSNLDITQERAAATRSMSGLAVKEYL